jgi:hypothetical protein
MPAALFDYYRIKPEFKPPLMEDVRRYVRPGELGAHADPDQWDLFLRGLHLSPSDAATVERRGYREVRVRIMAAAAKRANARYGRTA